MRLHCVKPMVGAASNKGKKIINGVLHGVSIILVSKHIKFSRVFYSSALMLTF